MKSTFENARMSPVLHIFPGAEASVKALAMIWALLICWGCGTHRAYSGPRRPRSAVAILVPSGGSTYIIKALDGQELATLCEYVAVLPGEHTLTLRLMWRNLFVETADVSFTVVAGQRYYIGVSQNQHALFGSQNVLPPLSIVPLAAASVAEVSTTKRPPKGEMTYSIAEGSWDGRVITSVTLHGPP
jgi:hypothetical protein